MVISCVLEFIAKGNNNYEPDIFKRKSKSRELSKGDWLRFRASSYYKLTKPTTGTFLLGVFQLSSSDENSVFSAICYLNSAFPNALVLVSPEVVKSKSAVSFKNSCEGFFSGLRDTQNIFMYSTASGISTSA